MIDRGQMIVIGSGENHLPLIYVGDVAEGVLLAGEAEQADGRTYLLVNDEPVTQRDFVTAIAAELGAPMPTRRIPYGLAVLLGGRSRDRRTPGTPAATAARDALRAAAARGRESLRRSAGRGKSSASRRRPGSPKGSGPASAGTATPAGRPASVKVPA